MAKDDGTRSDEWLRQRLAQRKKEGLLDDQHYTVAEGGESKGRAAECQNVGHDFETTELDDDNVEWLCRRCGYRAVETHSEGGL